MLSAEQLRAARALLRWDQATIADHAGVSIETIKRLEKMDGPLMSTKTATLHVLERAFRAAGVDFIPENGGGAGVRLRRRNDAKLDEGLRPDQLTTENDGGVAG
ncbi:helix-turn-helix domain-containing protein [Methylobacterium thuringiense]|uniref:XRE family transcriptional regulator n=1 Tax=Methylobacterium thuringiense TaxID=1003091 RepID=A0ABQ4TPQ7_9HYPH|nr:helix-turn-helix domain-containing protein [Methylobacterium thuringiense]GJE57329.1 hypothetical protein EKPJFOCH_3843 [Methylobacterium thuringiense]